MKIDNNFPVPVVNPNQEGVFGMIGATVRTAIARALAVLLFIPLVFAWRAFWLIVACFGLLCIMGFLEHPTLNPLVFIDGGFRNVWRLGVELNAEHATGNDAVVRAAEIAFDQAKETRLKHTQAYNEKEGVALRIAWNRTEQELKEKGGWALACPEETVASFAGCRELLMHQFLAEQGFSGCEDDKYHLAEVGPVVAVWQAEELRDLALEYETQQASGLAYQRSMCEHGADGCSSMTSMTASEQLLRWHVAARKEMEARAGRPITCGRSACRNSRRLTRSGIG